MNCSSGINSCALSLHVGGGSLIKSGGGDTSSTATGGGGGGGVTLLTAPGHYNSLRYCLLLFFCVCDA